MKTALKAKQSSAMQRFQGFAFQRFQVVHNNLEMADGAVQFGKVNIHVVAGKLFVVAMVVRRQVGSAGLAFKRRMQALVEGFELFFFFDQMLSFENRHVVTPLKGN